MNQPKSFQISKLDAAKRQLETAVRMFLLERDVVSTHTLASAAHQILADLGRKKGTPSVFKDQVLKMIRPEKKKEYLELISKAENYFKHADKDSDEPLEFFYGSTEYTIWDACQLYKSITNEIVPIMMAFNLWFFCKHNDLVTDPEVRKAFEDYVQKYGSENKAFFLKLAPELEKKFS